jgi:hypothetical protein
MAAPGGPRFGVAVRFVLDSVLGSGADPGLVTAKVAEITAAAQSMGITIPAEVSAPENSEIYKSLSAEMGFASEVVSGSYGSTAFHLVAVDGERLGFQTMLGPGPLTDLVTSAAAIAMLDTLVHAADLFGWTTDREHIARIVEKARQVNQTAMEQWLLLQQGDEETTGQVGPGAGAG